LRHKRDNESIKVQSFLSKVLQQGHARFSTHLREAACEPLIGETLLILPIDCPFKRHPAIFRAARLLRLFVRIA
jgi:hypothetical protein